MKPMPPWRAMAMARRASVTVSMAEATIGIFSAILRERQVRVSVCVGSTEDLPGRSRTSSNVKASGMGPSIIKTPMIQKSALKRKSPAICAGLDKGAYVANRFHQGSLYFRGTAERNQVAGGGRIFRRLCQRENSDTNVWCNRRRFKFGD